jgi:hypothetical protein
VHRFTSKIAAIVAFAAAGFLLAASTLTANGSDIRVERPAQLRDLVQNEANKIDKLENNLINIQSEIEEITNGSVRTEIESTQVKIQHQIHTETLNNVIYFKNSTDTHIYTNTCILFIGTGQTLTHNCYIAQYLLGISNINASIVNSQYKLSLLKIA